MPTVLPLLLTLALLAGCGGMNRAVGVLPNTLDNLAADTAPLRDPPRQPGDAALADTQRR